MSAATLGSATPRSSRTLRRGAASPPPPAVLPVEVRALNLLAGLIVAVLAVGALAAAVQWLTRASLFTIRAIELDGALARTSVEAIRNDAGPRLVGNFFSVDLRQAQAAFEAVPWVRRAEVRRVWPARLLVLIEEHRPAALWLGAEEDIGGLERLVNEHGELFDANLGDVDDDGLPLLAGPEGGAAAALALYRRLAPPLAAAGLEVQRVGQTARGSWRVRLEGGARIELGRGSADEVVARTERFARTLAEATARWQRPLEYADLRYPDAYAVRLAGLGTAPAAGTGSGARPAASSATTATAPRGNTNPAPPRGETSAAAPRANNNAAPAPQRARPDAGRN
jgi:cell division protein FtsQ